MVPHIWGALGATLSPTYEWDGVHHSLAASHCFHPELEFVQWTENISTYPYAFSLIFKEMSFGETFFSLID